MTILLSAVMGTIDSGAIGDVRVVHNVHRNASSHTSATSTGIVTGSMIHELDTIGWLLDDTVASIRIESPVLEGLKDPQLATIWMSRGTMVTAEVFVNAGYGYDVRCEVVGTAGTASLGPTSRISTRVAGVEGVAIRDDFVAHFADAYRIELASWALQALNGTQSGPTAWDGFVANLIAEAGVASLSSGDRETVSLPDRPSLYP